MGKRPVTLCTCQWADLPLDELCALAEKIGSHYGGNCRTSSMMIRF